MRVSWQEWFVWGDTVGPLAPAVWDAWLVALSIVIACAGGVAAMQLCAIARRPDAFGPTVSRAAYALAALGMGSSVWGMHFIGMLAVDICQPVRYDPWITGLSMLPALIASWVGLRMYARPAPAVAGSAGPPTRLRWPPILWGGLWVGAGIGTMHYSGMAAMRMESTLRYDPMGFALSIVVAVVLAIIGLGAREWLRHRGRMRGFQANLLAGLILGLATVGMHYTAMRASLFIGPVDLAYPRWSNRQVELALAVAGALVVGFGFSWGALGLLSYRTLLQRLREREALLSTILDDMPLAVLRLTVHDDGTTLPALASRAVQNLVGLPAEGYLNRQWTLLQRIHPDDVTAAHQAFNHALETQQPQRFEARVRHESAGWRHALVLATCYRNERQRHLHIYALDITNEARISRERRTLLEAIDHIACRAILSTDRRFVEVNDTLAHALGYSAAELVGQPHAAVWPEDEQAAQQYEQLWSALLDGYEEQGFFPRKRRDGSIVYLQGAYRPLLDDDGRVRAVLKIALDVTDRERTVQTLEKTRAQLQAALASRTAFFASFSHEIRTPMNAILGYAELLREALPINSAEREQVDIIVNAGRSLLRILNDLLDAAKLERSEFKLAPTPVVLPRLLHGLISRFGVLAQPKGLRLQLDVDDALPACIEADGDRLEQILSNLIGNALKFTERGHVTVGARRADAQTLHLWVEDSGIGIPKERQQAIFEPFVQADAVTTRRYGGTGLGMTIVKRLVELMQGELSLQSEPGVGTRIDIRLPLHVLPTHDCAEAAPPHSPAAAAPDAALPPLRVLAADDVEQNRTLLHTLLTRWGHAACVVDGGEALLARYAQDPAAWDVVLLDLHMPELDGLQTCQRLRALEHERGLRPIPVYALTAAVMEEDRRAAAQAGMDGFLEKPIHPAALRHVLQAAAERAGAVMAAGSAGEGTHTAPAPTAADKTAAGPVVDAEQGRALWHDDWLPRVRQWWAEMAPQWAAMPTWDRTAWHRCAGVAANLGLAALAAAARACEQALVRGEPAPVDAAQRAVHATAAWLQESDSSRASAAAPPAAPAADALSAPPAPAIVQRLRRACQRGEVDEPALQALRQTHPTVAQVLQQALDNFDFDGALRCLQNLGQETTDAAQP